MANRDKPVSNQDKIVTNQDTMAEMQDLVRQASEPWLPGDSVKAAIGRAARRLGLPHRRARTLWYAAPAAVLAWEADQIRARSRVALLDRVARLDRERAALGVLVLACGAAAPPDDHAA